MIKRLALAAFAAIFAFSSPAAFAQGVFGNFAISAFATTATISATTTSSSTTFTGVNADDSELLISNAGAGTAFCRWGTGAQTAVATDVPIFPNTIQTFYKGRGANVVACITASGTATVYVTTGYGR